MVIDALRQVTGSLQQEVIRLLMMLLEANPTNKKILCAAEV